MKTQTKDSQSKLTPKDAYKILVEGNRRFSQNLKYQRNLKEQVLQTSDGQYPFAAILSCIDSRVPVELIFDLGIGDVFSVRVAGNIVNTDILGSLEYSCKVAGAKLIVVLGHSKCGAVTAACNHIELGNITHLLKRINPVVEKTGISQFDESAIEKVAQDNVHWSVDRIRKESPILAEMEQKGEIELVGAYYDVGTGIVTFYKD